MVAGAPLDRIRAGNTERNLAGVPDSREFRGHGAYVGDHRERQIGIAKQLFAAMNIAREDKDGRQDFRVLRGFRQFDAPISVVRGHLRPLDPCSGDIAPVRLRLRGDQRPSCNAAWSRGLGCVINSQGIMQSPVVREHAAIPDDQVIMICVAMGFPDDSFPANAVVSQRKAVDDAAVFVGFDE